MWQSAAFAMLGIARLAEPQKNGFPRPIFNGPRNDGE